MFPSIKKINKALEELNPDRIYVENMRYLLGTSSRIARLVCNIAVRKGHFEKYYAIECKNENCRRIIGSYKNLSEIPDKVTCFLCEEDGEKESQFSTKELNIIPFYKYIRKSYELA
tara:strand:+ start:32 stop:379 length:348 start_codon:yes stop_codon:yes gene_type:complete